MGTMFTFIVVALLGLVPRIWAQEQLESGRQNSTYYNPILPGFHPDPSCIFVPSWDDTFFCASSSFNAFPGIPIHASKDLQNWKLVAHVLNRKEQLPRLAETNRSTSGIWAPSLRYREESETFYVVTTLVDDDREQEDSSRWDNVIFQSNDPYDPEAWTEAVHFDFEGYDTCPFWDDDGKVYITGAHAWRVSPGIHMAEADLETGEVGEWQVIWEGTGGLAPEGPHVYSKDGWYYLLAAEGGTGLEHMVTISRSKNISGPYESNPANPILSNSNTTNYFQTVGHADLFQDGDGNWWAVALSTRGGAEYRYFPMVRETVMAPMTWEEGEWPYLSQINGVMEGWPMPEATADVPGNGPFITQGDDITFPPGSEIPPHFTYWRYPIPESYSISPEGHDNTLRLNPSVLNLTALNGNYAGPTGQTFVGRRQQDTLFTYQVDIEFTPTESEEEAGVSVFLTQNHHLDMGVILLPASSKTDVLPVFVSDFEAAGEEEEEENEDDDEVAEVDEDEDELIPHIRFRGFSYIAVPDEVIVPVPEQWRGQPLTLEVKAANMTHYSFSVGPVGIMSEMETVMTVSNEGVSWGFTGVLLGVFCTTNGGDGDTPAYFSNWKYTPQGQFRA